MGLRGRTPLQQRHTRARWPRTSCWCRQQQQHVGSGAPFSVGRPRVLRRVLRRNLSLVYDCEGEEEVFGVAAPLVEPGWLVLRWWRLAATASQTATQKLQAAYRGPGPPPGDWLRDGNPKADPAPLFRPACPRRNRRVSPPLLVALLSVDMAVSTTLWYGSPASPQ
jgi:hypothetical protein